MLAHAVGCVLADDSAPLAYRGYRRLLLGVRLRMPLFALHTANPSRLRHRACLPRDV